MIRTGIGFDVHRFKKGRALVLGGVKIACDRGLDGHSDADVLTHAVMDALLGAVAADDIGVHFSDTDKRWKNADSLRLLRRVVDVVRAKGATLVNVDVTVLAEIPRLAPHRVEMRRRLAKAMEVGVDAVSVKATTMERLGAIGRKEGIAAMAVATVEMKKKVRDSSALKNSIAAKKHKAGYPQPNIINLDRIIDNKIIRSAL
ncbi:MAG: 2-C-methyl-D-erythritol 2,4-cyclodiphosphate synthase [Lentisphaerae bacterium]|nr:2-C-methyl-D-erythritol 2,4-cyclodiphosphate synthase [Lentisphaerota bacterium]